MNGGLFLLNLPDYLIDRVAQIHLTALPGQLRKPPPLRQKPGASAQPTASLKLLFKRKRLVPIPLNLSMKIKKRLCSSTAWR